MSERGGEDAQRDAGDGRALVACLIGAHLLLTVPLAVLLNVWVDEVYSLHSTAGSVADAVTAAIDFEKQAPGYFLLLGLWRGIDASPVFARMLSVLCVAAALLAAARVSRRVFPGWSPAWLVGFLAFHPVLVWAALEIRVYAVTVLAAGLVLVAFFSLCLRGRDGDAGQRRAVAAMAAAGAFALYVQYYLGFLLAGLGLAVLIVGSGRDLRRYALAMAIVALLCLPILTWLPGQVGQEGGLGGPRFTPRAAVGFGLHAIGASLVPGYDLLARLDDRSLYERLVWVLRGSLVLGAGLLLVATGSLGAFLRNRRVLALGIAFGTAVAAFALVGLAVGSNLIQQPRYWSYLAFLAGIVWMSIPAATGRPAVLASLLAATLALHGTELVDHYRPLAKEGDTERLARFLEAHEEAGQPILVFPNELAMPIRVYYRGVNEIVPVPREVSLEHYDPRNAAIRSRDEVSRLLDGLGADAARPWLVRRNVWGYWGVDYRLELLDAEVEARYAKTRAAEFFGGVTVWRLEPRAGGAGR